MPNSLHYGVGPGMAALVVLVLAAVSRWVFTPARRRRRDYGLLVPVATAPTRSEAERLVALLRGHGLRATVGPDPRGDEPVRVSPRGEVVRPPRGRVAVLVFAEDTQTARAILEPDDDT